jgi:hypothetical protein
LLPPVTGSKATRAKGHNLTRKTQIVAEEPGSHQRCQQHFGGGHLGLRSVLEADLF